MLGDVGDDALHLIIGVAEAAKRPRDRLVDDLHGPAAHQLLGLDQREVRLDARGVAIHHQADRPGRRQDGRLSVAVAVLVAERHGLIPRRLGRLEQALRDQGGVDLLHCRSVLSHHPKHGVAVRGVAGERPHLLGDLRAGPVRPTGHEGRDGARPRPPPVRVVGQAAGHEQRTQVRVAQTELPERLRVALDLVGRIARVPDDDLLRREHHLDGVLEGRDVEVAVVLEEPEQVEAGQIARAVVEMHVLRARVRRIDASRGRARVPVVDRRVELHARVGALPGRLGQLPHEVAGPDGLQRFLRRHRLELPVPVLEVAPHELVGDPDRIVGVLVLHRVGVLAVQVHVEPGVPEHPSFPLLHRLAPDEVADVRMVGVHDHHLGRPASLPPGLDRPGGSVGATHEGDRTAGGPAARQVFLGRTKRRQVDPRARPPLEDDSFLGIPVEDGPHAVVDGEDEARGALGLLLVPHVEPDRRVERSLLRHQEVRKLLREDPGVGVAGEVAVPDSPPADGVDDPANHLPDRPLALGGPELAPEVLLGDDVGGVLRPALRELHVPLLEGVAPLLVIGNDGIARLPLDLIEWMDALPGEMPFEGKLPPRTDIFLLGCHHHPPARRLLGRAVPVEIPVE